MLLVFGCVVNPLGLRNEKIDVSSLSNDESLLHAAWQRFRLYFSAVAAVGVVISCRLDWLRELLEAFPDVNETDRQTDR